MVYKAQHQHLQNIFVAVKVMHPHLVQDQKYLDSLKQECAILHHLQHENIVGFRELILGHRPPAIIMEYLDGADAEEIRSKGPFNFSEIVHIAKETLKGLHYAHQKGVIHRDIKPSNIFICKDGSIKIADFGISKNTEFGKQTSTGILKGTLNYMAPELFEQGAASPSTDMYALGLTLWELCVGQLACKQGSLMTKVNWHLTQQITDVRTKVLQCPEEIARIIMWMCQSSPKTRPQSAMEALNRWKAIDESLLYTPNTQKEADDSSNVTELAITLPPGFVASQPPKKDVQSIPPPDLSPFLSSSEEKLADAEHLDEPEPMVYPKSNPAPVPSIQPPEPIIEKKWNPVYFVLLGGLIGGILLVFLLPKDSTDNNLELPQESTPAKPAVVQEKEPVESPKKETKPKKSVKKASKTKKTKSVKKKNLIQPIITLSSDEPAKVYIDGKKSRKGSSIQTFFRGRQA